MQQDLARLGQRVRERREALDLTQQEAALQAGVSDTTWQTLELAKAPVSRKSLRGAERTLGWVNGSARAILEGGEPQVETSGVTASPIDAMSSADGQDPYRDMLLKRAEQTAKELLADLRARVDDLEDQQDGMRAELDRLRADIGAEPRVVEMPSLPPNLAKLPLQPDESALLAQLPKGELDELAEALPKLDEHAQVRRAREVVEVLRRKSADAVRRENGRRLGNG